MSRWSTRAGGLSPEVEAKLDRWVAAKREKDFTTADAIRSELRAQGLEPDNLRPPGSEAHAGGLPGKYLDAETELQLDRWVQAKRDKDWAAADAIRTELRAKGVEPDIVRPPGSELRMTAGFAAGAPLTFTGSSTFAGSEVQPGALDPLLEAQLDRWVLAKREKDFGTADAIRAELRALGIEPDTLRPPERDIGGVGAPSRPLLLGGSGASARYDAETEEKLDRWVQAKRDKDWDTADSIRSELRAQGIEPDIVRPPGGVDPQAAMLYDPDLEAKLDRWVLAKREKDFATADEIRAELRAIGIEPDTLRPPDRDVTLGRRYDAATEAQLDRWVQAKRDKDFALADSIRAELRQRGLEPDILRPNDRDAANSLAPLQWTVLPMAPAMLGAAALPQLQGGMFAAQPALTADVQIKLDRWVLAKREKDFAKADAIRSELRALGIEPDTLRPPGGELASLAAMPAMPRPVLTPMVSPGRYDSLTEAQLDRWVQAKRDKDWVAADAIRSELRTKGIEPDLVRPPGSDANAALEREIEAKLDRWVLAKREKDFVTADAIRSELRAQGIEPDIMRPPSGEIPVAAAAAWPTPLLAAAPRHDAATEALLDRWVAAKRDKDFATADAIRAELRRSGIEPDIVRPGGRSDASAVLPGTMMPTPAAMLAGSRFSGGAQSQWGYMDAGAGGVVLQPVWPQMQYMMPVAQPVMQIPLRRKVYDAETEADLDRWVQAKRDKDFEAADAIRSKLRARGVEPDIARPSGKAVQPIGFAPAPVEASIGRMAAMAPLNLSPGLQREAERQLDRYAAARTSGNAAEAEAIARQLRSRGLDPDAAEAPPKRAKY